MSSADLGPAGTFFFEGHPVDAQLIAIDYWCQHNWGGPNAHYCTDPLYRLHCKIDYRPAPSNNRGLEDEDESVNDAYSDLELYMGNGIDQNDLETLVDMCQEAIRSMNGE